jgi:hypothetical protein
MNTWNELGMQDSDKDTGKRSASLMKKRECSCSSMASGVIEERTEDNGDGENLWMIRLDKGC